MKNAKLNALTSDWSGLFKILAKGAEITTLANPDFISVAAANERLKVPVADLSLLAAKGLVHRQSGKLYLTEAGENLVSASDSVSIRVERANAAAPLVARNDDESPLNALRRHKGADGKPFLTDRQFEAGERLRGDFTRGQLSPRMSANWQASVASGRRSGSEGGIADLTNAAMTARQRFRAALEGIGPDLGGAVTDVCCFLKGLELVEIERRWPKRSAKFMLRAGLTLLAMHYAPVSHGPSAREHRWGASDYRPVIR